MRVGLTYRLSDLASTARPLAARFAALSLSATLAITLAAAPLASAFGADGESEQSAEAPASVQESSEAAAPSDAPDSDASDDVASSEAASASSPQSEASSKEASSAEEKKRKEKEEAAAKKHAEADALFAQIDSLNSSYSSAQAEKEAGQIACRKQAPDGTLAQTGEEDQVDPGRNNRRDARSRRRNRRRIRL